jgi:hypothetical protein
MHKHATGAGRRNDLRPLKNHSQYPGRIIETADFNATPKGNGKCYQKYDENGLISSKVFGISIETPTRKI